MSNKFKKVQYFPSTIACHHAVRTLKLLSDTNLVATWVSYNRFSVTVLLPEGKPLVEESKTPASLQVQRWFRAFSLCWYNKTGRYPVFRELHVEDFIMVGNELCNVGAFDIIDGDNETATTVFEAHLKTMFTPKQTNEIQNIEAVIVCGGKSSRMQGLPKGLLTLGTATFAEVLMDTCRHFKDVKVNANDKRYEVLGCEIYGDETDSVGPLSAIYTALRITESERVLIVPCDTPFITEELLKALANESKVCDAVAVRCNGRIYPTIACYSKSVLPKLCVQLEQGDYKALRFLESVNANYLDWENATELANINTPEDYQRLLGDF